MAKLILIVVVFAAVYLIVKAYSRSLGRKPGSAEPAPAEDMVRCLHCGVHLPRVESIGSEGERYCSEEHRQLHAR